MSMPMQRFYNEFQRYMNPEEKEFFKYLLKLASSDKDINWKSDIINPQAHSTLDLCAVYYKEIGQTTASELIEFWSKSLKEQQPAMNGKRAEQIINAFTAIYGSLFNKGERSLGEKALGVHKEE